MSKHNLSFEEFASKFFEPDKLSKGKYRGEIYYGRYYRLSDRYIFSEEDVDSARRYYNETGQDPE